MRTAIHTSIIVTVAFFLLGCNKSPTEPSQTGAAVVLTHFNITSMPTGTAIGQTIQLTATAEYLDKTTKNVTSDAVWTSLDPSVATVSTAGVVTVVSFGVSNITAQYQSLKATRQFIARRSDSGLTSYHLSGVATGEDGRSLAGAKVIINYIVDGNFRVNWQETTTDPQGRYELDFDAMTAVYFRGSTSNVILVADGFEPFHGWFRPVGSDPRQTLNLHARAIRWINAGEAVSVTVADDGEQCSNNVHDLPDYSVQYVCRTVRLVVPADGVLTATAVSANPAVHVLVEMEGPGSLDCCYEDNPISMRVAAGMVVNISVAVLEGLPSQTITLTATIR